MGTTDLTRAERAFRAWMLICAIMFLFAVPLFLFAGVWIVPAINLISAKLLPLPLYPLPPSGLEGAFWRVLGVSMMAMLTWACLRVWSDVRRYGWVVGVVLISKLCSSVCYLSFFLIHHEFAYLVGVLTDGPIFLITLVLWFGAAPGNKFLSQKEESILTILGDAILPRGGAFRVGYQDLQAECLADTRRILATMDPLTLLGFRFMLRGLNLTPLFVARRAQTVLTMHPNERAAFLIRLEEHRGVFAHMMIIAAKMLVLLPFFNQRAGEEAVGYVAPVGPQP